MKTLKHFEVVHFKVSRKPIKLWRHAQRCAWALKESICEQAIIVSLQNDITSYWPVMHKALILDIFRDPCEWVIFKNI